MQSEAPFPPDLSLSSGKGRTVWPISALGGESTQRCPKVLPLAGRYFPTVSELFGAVRERTLAHFVMTQDNSHSDTSASLSIKIRFY